MKQISTTSKHNQMIANKRNLTRDILTRLRENEIAEAANETTRTRTFAMHVM